MSGYMREAESILDWVDRGCLRLLKTGGGSVSGDCPPKDCPVKASRLRRVREMCECGMYNAEEIAAETGMSITTVKRIQKEVRASV